ncbi:uncharacterized protein LOC128659619 [Bombina bombina]|uniref:uncharacterized protein LOC128659619 n=1 Tax=Bombina bombina TaxID=8345 RepID=UPI00235AF180|nr:uncharacterized protein LOC128659619 [Bombina bombina]
MSKESSETNHSYIHRTSVEQLLKCYSSNKTYSSRKTDSKHLTEQSERGSGPVTINRLSIARHAEQRLRPQTCSACRTYVNQGSKSSTQNAPPVASLMPLNQLNHLPYYPSRAKQNKQKSRHKSKVTEKQGKRSKNLISCSFRAENHVQESSSSCISSSNSRLSGSMEAKMRSFPALPARTKSELCKNANSISVPQHTQSCDTELREWIVLFGGDERAAFMARGLQKLQLAYELGKAEVKKAQTETHCEQE